MSCLLLLILFINVITAYPSIHKDNYMLIKILLAGDVTLEYEMYVKLFFSVLCQKLFGIKHHVLFSCV